MPRGKRNNDKMTKNQPKYCAEDMKNFCIQKKKYKDEMMVVSDYTIFPTNKLSVLQCLEDSNNINNIGFKKVDNLSEVNSSRKEKSINNMNELLHNNLEDKVYTLYLNLGYDTYKYVIELEDNYEMTYERLVRIGCHAVKDLISNLQHEHNNKKKQEMAKKERKEQEGKEYKMKLKYEFEPIEQLKNVVITSFGIGIFEIYEDEEGESSGRNEEKLRNPKEIIIDYFGFDPRITEEMEADI